MGFLAVLVVLAVGCPLSFAAQPASFLNLDLRQDRYLSEVQHSAQESNFTQISAQLKLEPKTRRWLTYKIDGRAQGALNAKGESYVGVPEIYSATDTGPVQVTVGRRRRTWSRLDEQFHLGVWQPELRWDYLAPEQQGLTGLFVQAKASESLRFTLFGSYVNIPDQGPQYRLENGQFKSSNRWFQQPSGAFGLFKDTPYATDAPLFFDIDRPSNEDLFLNPSLGVGMDYDAESGYFLHTNYAYKPRNQIHLGLEGVANLGGRAPVEVNAIIHPKIIMHHVATVETGFDGQDQRAFVSLTAERPERSGFPSAYEEAPLDDVVIAGAAYQHYAGSWFLRRPSWLQYSYMRVFAVGSKSKESALQQDDLQSSLDRYPLKSVAALDWKIRLAEKASNRVEWTNRYWYSPPEQGGWLSSHLDWSQGALTWRLGADVLGSRVEPRSRDAGLFTRYRTNDRFFGGVSYVF